MMYSFFPGLVAGYCLLIGVFFWNKTKPHRARTALLALCMATFLWQMTWAVLFQVRDPVLANALITFGYLVIIFLPTTLYLFLTEVSEAHEERPYVYVSYGFALILAVILLSSDLFVSGYYEFYWGYYPKAGVIHPLHVLQTMLVVTRGLLVAYAKQKSAFDPLKSQLRYSIASLLIYAFAAVDYLCNYGVAFYPPGLFFISFSLTIMAYAMLKKEQLDIQVVITQLVAYVVTFVLIVLTFVSVNMLPELNNITMLLFNIVAALIWGRHGRTLRRKIQTISERKWLHDWYDPREVNHTLTRQLDPLLDKKGILLAISCTLAKVLAVKEIHVLLRERHDFCCYLNGQDMAHVISLDHPLSGWLAARPATVILFTDVPSEMKYDNPLEFSPGSLLLPLHSSEKLEGVLVLGARTVDMHYLQKDRQLLISVARQAMMHLDRVLAHENKMAEIRAIAGNIAHELRTPLTTISMAAKSFAKYLPDLWAGYEAGVQHALASTNQVAFIIPAHRRHFLESGVDNIGRTAHQAHTIISLLLANVHSDAIDETSFDCYAMQSCLKKALADYPFRTGEKAKLHVDKTVDFDFKGSDSLLIYALYNLIKNAFYYIAQAGKGEIQIWLIRGCDVNTLHFKDTGAGISATVLPAIFKPFYTTKAKDTGNGLGLSFCQRVVDSFNGQIECRSVEGAYTEFILQLPCIVD